MHDTAALTGNAFFRCYGDPLCATLPPYILDVGSYDVNGTLRPYAPVGSNYVGVDMVPGPGVDLVLADPYQLPFPADAFELVVSTSCLEHDPFFWLTFAEMARVLLPGGFLYISVPSNGPYHGHPGDCWRFYADSASALCCWAARCGTKLEIVETFMMPPRRDIWIDCVSVFGKPPVPARPRISEMLRQWGRTTLAPT